MPDEELSVSVMLITPLTIKKGCTLGESREEQASPGRREITISPVTISIQWGTSSLLVFPAPITHTEHFKAWWHHVAPLGLLQIIFFLASDKINVCAKRTAILTCTAGVGGTSPDCL